ncbi:MAG TPA: type III pantothenate kinase [Eggerthellaceae bacterium]|nr:type III pantothenate kinase [Eggerthellaceae bacterium]
MLLAIDIGNTQTVIGVYDGEELRHMWRIASGKSDTSDELRMKLLPLLESEGLHASAVCGAVMASVVPTLGASWQRALARTFGFQPVICSATSAAGLFDTTYANPSEIGADRIADAVAARFLYGAPVVVVDFGTATNLEVIDAQGRFVGGIIAPGLETSAAALFLHATKLPTIDLADPGSAIGTNTVHAIQSGIVYGEADRVDGFVRRVFAELGYEAPVVATGGLATTMAPLCRTVTDVNPELTLLGLRLVHEAGAGRP